ncbi:MAG: hypothetical protein ACRBF0_03725 [Calditrichia bacterium]
MTIQHRASAITKTIMPLILLLLFLSTAKSQTIEQYKEAMDSALKAADFEEALHHGHKLLQFPDLLKQTAELAHETLAISFFHTAQLDSSKQHFINLLNLNENANLDPIRTSPKILRFFEDVRKDFVHIKRLQQPTEEPESPITIKEKLAVPDIRPSAGVRSLLLPGLGQWQKGHKTRSIFFAGTVSGLIAATAYVWLKESDAKKVYTAATFFPEIDQLYKTYNDRQKKRKTLLLSTGIAWGLTVLDAFRSPYVQPTINVDTQGDIQTSLRLRFNLR